MKALTALLVTVALVTPAFAQNPTLQDLLKKQKGSIVVSATKPVLLHTGKPITANDKKQLLSTVVKTYKTIPRLAGVKVTNTGAAQSAPTSATLTPQMMYTKGLVKAVAYTPAEASPGENMLMFYSGYANSLFFDIDAIPNTAYMLSIQVFAGSSAPQFMVSNSLADGISHGDETFTGVFGNNEFAYLVTSNSQGTIHVSLYSSNATWDFTSCEITATPIN